MRKFLFFLLILGAIAATPYGVGIKVEENFTDKLTQFNDLPLYLVEVKNYERGYLRSRARVRVGFDSAELQDLVQLESGSTLTTSTMDLFVDIQHGPVLIDNGYGLGWTDLSGVIDRESYPKWREFFKALKKDKLYAWNARVNLDGSGWFKSDFPDHDLIYEKDGQQITFAVSGYKDQIDFAPRGGAVVVDYSMDKLVLGTESTVESTTELASPPTFQLSMEDFRGEADVSYAGAPFGLGTGQISVGKLDGGFGAFEQITTLQMEEFYVYAKVEEGESAQTLDVRESIQIESANFNGYNAENMEFTFRFENITKELAYAQIQQPELFRVDENGQLSEESQVALDKLVNDAMRKNPKVALEKVTFRSKDGELDMGASVDVNSALLPADVDYTDTFSVIPALAVLANMEISESLVRTLMVLRAKTQTAGLPDEQRPTEEQIEQQVNAQIALGSAALVQQGFIKLENGKYSTDFSYDEGIATLNRKVIGGLPGL